MKWIKKQLSSFGWNVGMFFELGMLVIPVNLGKTHWVLVVVDIKNTRIDVYDSFPPSDAEYMDPLLKFLVAAKFTNKVISTNYFPSDE